MVQAALLNDGLVESAQDSTTTTTTTTVNIWSRGTWQCHTLVDTCPRCWSITKKSESSSSSLSTSFSSLSSSSGEFVHKPDWLKTQLIFKPAIKHDQPLFPSTHHLNMFSWSLSLSELYATAAVATLPFFSLLSAVVQLPARTVLCLLFCSKCVITMYSLCSYCYCPLFFGIGWLNSGDCILIL